MTTSRQKDQVEIILGRADDTIKHVETALRKTTLKAVVKGAGALRRQVDDLRVRLEKLSVHLAHLEPQKGPAAVRPELAHSAPKPASKPARKPVARPAARVRRARPSKARRSKAA